MRFWITSNPEIALRLIPWLVEVNEGRMDMYLELRSRLTYNPDETFVCLAIEGNLLKGMTIAYCRHNDVFIWQVRTEKGVPRSIVDFGFEGVKHWARSKGYSKITGFPNRAKRIWQRRWGFKESKSNKDEVYLEV